MWMLSVCGCVGVVGVCGWVCCVCVWCVSVCVWCVSVCVWCVSVCWEAARLVWRIEMLHVYCKWASRSRNLHWLTYIILFPTGFLKMNMFNITLFRHTCRGANKARCTLLQCIYTVSFRSEAPFTLAL